MKTTNQIDREANERKAREIANDNCTHICLADCSAESYFSSENDCYKAAMQAMQWKDKERKELWRITRNHYQEWAEEQIAKEKQRWIAWLEKQGERNNIVEQLTAFAQHLNKRGAFRDDLIMDFEHEAQSFIEMQNIKEL